jgi:hypothetical protein
VLTDRYGVVTTIVFESLPCECSQTRKIYSFLDIIVYAATIRVMVMRRRFRKDAEGSDIGLLWYIIWRKWGKLGNSSINISGVHTVNHSRNSKFEAKSEHRGTDNLCTMKQQDAYDASEFRTTKQDLRQLHGWVPYNEAGPYTTTRLSSVQRGRTSHNYTAEFRTTKQ